MRAVLNKHNNQEYTPMHTRKTKKSFILKTTLIISLLFSSNYMLGQKASTNFQDFYKRFETDCDYQQSHVALPITSVVLDNIDINDNEIYDTLTIDEWKCEKKKRLSRASRKMFGALCMAFRKPVSEWSIILC